MKLTANQKRALRHLWKGELTRAEIAEEMSWTDQQLDQAAEFLGLPERPDPDVYLPSLEEIRLATATIRSQWSQADREARICAAWGVKLKATEEDNNAGRRPSDHRGEGNPAHRKTRREAGGG